MTRLFSRLVLTSLLLGGPAFADVTISGTQTRGRGADGKLRCSRATVPNGGAIVQVLGAEGGFWLESSAGGVLRFDRAADAVGNSLAAGTWCAYPNLYRNQDEASVAVVIRTGDPGSSTAAPSPSQTPGAGIVGTWRRTDGSEVYTFSPDGRASAQTGITGAWTKTGTNQFRVTWTHRPPGQQSNYIDSLTLSADGRTLSGKNNFGNQVTTTRIQGAPIDSPTYPDNGIVGTWKRTDGPEIYTFTSDGRASAQTGITGTWARSGPNQFTVKWTHRPPGKPSNYIDSLVLSPDGRTLSGRNNFGDHVSTIRQ